MLTLEEWNDRLAPFVQASSRLVDQRQLRIRTDSKFVLPGTAAAGIVSRLAADYALLSAGAVAIATYRTLYFDTADLELFHAQRRGRRVRHKVRVRHYPERSLSSLEVKMRRSELQTIKSWRDREYGSDELSEDDQAFVRLHTGLAVDVQPQAWTAFRRVTFLSLRTEERVTLDLDFRVGTEPGARSFGDLAILEVKQWPFRRTTVVMSALQAAGRRPGWMGKYFVAIAVTRPGIRVGELLPGVRALERVAA